MRITINVSDLTQEQYAWLLRNTAEDWQFLDSGETRACVVFEGNHGERSQIHREIPVRAWIGLVEHVKTITAADENVVGTNSGHGYVWERPDGLRARCGGPALCCDCRKDAATLRLWNS